jgi:hypothetical protein
MKKTIEVTRLAFPAPLAAALLFAGCASLEETQPHGEALGPVFETAEQIRAMLPCKARVVERGPCYAYLQTAGGKGLYLGSPASEADVEGFLAVLKTGQQYELPEAFLDYERNPRRTQP